MALLKAYELFIDGAGSLLYHCQSDIVEIIDTYGNNQRCLTDDEKIEMIQDMRRFIKIVEGNENG